MKKIVTWILYPLSALVLTLLAIKNLEYALEFMLTGLVVVFGYLFLEEFLEWANIDILDSEEEIVSYTFVYTLIACLIAFIYRIWPFLLSAFTSLQENWIYALIGVVFFVGIILWNRFEVTAYLKIKYFLSEQELFDETERKTHGFIAREKLLNIISFNSLLAILLEKPEWRGYIDHFFQLLRERSVPNTWENKDSFISFVPHSISFAPNPRPQGIGVFITTQVIIAIDLIGFSSRTTLHSLFFTGS